MAKFEEIIVHVGLHKTGTTTIQGILHAHREPLEREFGIKYPGIHSNHSVVTFSLFSENPHQYQTNVVGGIQTVEAAASHNEQLAAKLEKEIDETRASRLLLSAEDVSSLSTEGLLRFREWLSRYTETVRLIAFIREPAAWTRSATEHLVRDGWTIGELSLEPPMQEIKCKLGRIADVFGKQALAVMDFSQARRLPGGILGSFCGLLGSSPLWVEEAQGIRDNVSCSQYAIELISALNRLRPLYADGQIGPMRIAGDIEGMMGIPGERFQLSPEVLQRIDEAAREDVSWVKQEFGISLSYSSPEQKPGERRTARQTRDDRETEAIALLISDSYVTRRVDVFWVQGIHALRNNDADGAARYLSEVARIKPERADVQRQLSSVYQLQLRRDEAISAMRRAIELEPRNVEYKNRLAYLLRQWGG